jgi:pimeloyl-ACP methyl ester carboxylesterase
LASPDVILIPGLMCDATVWEPQFAALGQDANFIVFYPDARNSLAAMAEALLAQAPATFALAGHSMGGRVALEVMRRAAHRVSGLALFNTAHRPLPAGPAGESERAARLALLDMARRDGMRAMGRQWLEGMIHPARRDDRALVTPILDMIERKSPELFAAQIQALLARPDATGVLANTKCPSLVLCGGEDARAAAAREISALISSSRLVIVPDCGHMSTLERPEAVNDALREWLAAMSSAA